MWGMWGRACHTLVLCWEHGFSRQIAGRRPSPARVLGCLRRVTPVPAGGQRLAGFDVACLAVCVASHQGKTEMNLHPEDLVAYLAGAPCRIFRLSLVGFLVCPLSVSSRCEENFYT